MPISSKGAYVAAIRAIFDGKAFIPQVPVSLPDQTEALVNVEQNDPCSQATFEAAVLAYYEQQHAGGADDDAWGKASAKHLIMRGLRTEREHQLSSQVSSFLRTPRRCDQPGANA